MADGPGFESPNFGSTLPPPLRSGPAWESDGPFAQRYVETVRPALTDPRQFFTNLRLTGGLAAPITYALVGIGAGAIGSAIWSTFGSFGFNRFGASYPAAGGGFVSVLVMTLVLSTVGLFIGAGIFHLMLSLLSAAKQPFEATFRTVAYAAGSTALFNLVPICGGVVGAVYGIVLYIIGLSATQECDISKAAIAVLTPVVVCCIAMVLFWTAIAALIFGAAAAGHALQ